MTEKLQDLVQQMRQLGMSYEAASREFKKQYILSVLASHRGRYEWGAARPPMTLEAIALHQLDTLNTQVSRFRDLLAARRDQDQPWTTFDRLLGRQLYAGPEDGAVRGDETEE